MHANLSLLQRYAVDRPVALRNQITQQNMGLVRKIAHRYVTKCRTPYEDLEQIGAQGLIKAVERFDPTEGAALSSFAVPYIRGEILHYLRDREDMVKPPRQDREDYNTVDKTVREMAKLGQFVTHLEAALACGLTAERWKEVLASTRKLPMVELDEAHATYEVEMPHVSALACLSYNQRRWLKMHYLEHLTVGEIAALVEKPVVEVHQGITAAVAKLANNHGFELPAIAECELDDLIKLRGNNKVRDLESRPLCC